MARTNSLFCFVAFILFVTLLCNGPNTYATRRILEEQPTKWCTAWVDVNDETLQKAIDYFCNQPEVDCNLIKPGGVCFLPDTKYDHASFAINMYYRCTGVCPSDVGVYNDTNPSHGACNYP